MSKKLIFTITSLCLMMLLSGCYIQLEEEIVQFQAPIPIKVDQKGLEEEFSFSSEQLGMLTLGLDETQIIDKMGEPEQSTEPEYWGSDGLMHKTWNFADKGMVIGLVESNDTFVIESITVREPFDGSTSRGIRIGSTASEVLRAYDKVIDNETGLTMDGDNKVIVVGSVYGGLIFQIENESVVQIFIGAAAE